jgi:hypothetical protein
MIDIRRSFPVCRQAIMTKEGLLQGQFGLVQGNRILALVQETTKFRLGTVFVPNGSLRGYSPNHTTHTAHRGGLYDAFRSVEHMIRRTGTQSGTGAGEYDILKLDADQLVHRANALLSYGQLTPEDVTDLQERHNGLIERFDRKRNEELVVARERFIRSAQITDVLDRHNPMAAAMATGGGINRLHRRQRQMVQMCLRLNHWKEEIYVAIKAHMDLYDELRRALMPGSTKHKPGELVELLHQDRCSQTTRLSLDKILREFGRAFGYVNVLPFYRNAQYMSKDLFDAADLACDGKFEELAKLFGKLRNSFTWVYAQNALEFEVIAPLSYLIEEMRMNERIRRRSLAAKPGRKIVVIRRMAPERFGRIESALKAFDGKLALCSDAGLVKPVKEDVIGFVALAFKEMKKDNWGSAKQCLIIASDLM